MGRPVAVVEVVGLLVVCIQELNEGVLGVAFLVEQALAGLRTLEVALVLAPVSRGVTTAVPVGEVQATPALALVTGIRQAGVLATPEVVVLA